MRTPREALAVLVKASSDGRLEAICKRRGLDLVSVFGSVLDEDRESPRDIDIAIRFLAGVEHDLTNVLGELIKLMETEKVDVMVLNQAGVVARSRALGAHSQGLYERVRGSYAMAQMAAITEEMETAYMRRLDLELLASR